MTFAFLILGDFSPEQGRTASIGGGSARMIGVPDLPATCAAARALAEEGIGCIELCGAFGPDGARQVIEATGGRIPVGYILQELQHGPPGEAVPALVLALRVAAV